MPTRKLLTADESLRRLEGALGIGYWTFVIATEALHWSPGLYALLGLKQDQILPDMSVYNGMIHPEDQREWDDILRMSRGSERTQSTVRIIRPTGELIWVRTQFISQFDRGGRLIAYHGVMTDVTDYENKLRLANSRWALAQSVKKMMQGAIWRAGPDGRLTDTADWVRFTGQSAEQARDWEALEAMHPEDRDHFRENWARSIRDRSPLHYRARIRDRTGQYVTYETRAVPIVDDEGRLVEWHGLSLPLNGIQNASAVDLTSAHIRAARALLDWTGPDLAQKSGISFSTIKRLEKSEGLVKPDTVLKVTETLESAGVRFGSDGCGKIWISAQKSKPTAVWAK
ncbi:PAS domain-containing protein [uncultured Agrobacterium sp.]|uniref:PAS domain-containing protein n=1 Tax=uncultured Agrobacterium sp. TaxID=157277 RepID=UPI002600D2A3|nr:PAS domain-containing protein [uncultured Agrobacterium sp.]